MRLRAWLKKALAKPAAEFGKNPTHCGLIKAAGLRIERAKRVRPAPEVIQIGAIVHKRKTFAPGQPPRWARRGASLPPGTVRTHDVPIYYQPVEDRSKYTGEKLRTICADGRHR